MDVGDNDLLKVYVRLPIRIKEELQIKNLHPDIQTVQLPRQRSRRWCFIIFQDIETRDKVVEHLETIKIKERKLVVKTFKQRQPRKVQTKNLTSEDRLIKARLELLKTDQ